LAATGTKQSEVSQLIEITWKLALIMGMMAINTTRNMLARLAIRGFVTCAQIMAITSS
jgi:hypothetical protein